MKHVIRAAIFVASVGLTTSAFAQDDGSLLNDRIEQLERDAQDAQRAQEDAQQAQGEAQAAQEDAGLARERAESAESRAAQADQRAAAAEQEAAASAAAATAAAAAAAALLEDTEEELPPGYYEGRWVGALGISGSFNLTSLSRVPGAPKGVSVGMNLSVDGVLDYLKAKHEWRNSLNLGAGLLRSASDSVWVKTNDVLKLQSGYYYALTSWFGPFAEFQFQTAMFPMTIRRNVEASFCAENDSYEDCLNGNGTLIAQGERLKVTGAFQPVQMHEKFGIFVRPVDRTYFRMAFRTGFAAQQFYVKENSYLEVNRNGAGDAILLRDLHTYGLFGFLADMNIRGAAKSEGVLYGANAALLLPLADTSKSRRREDNVNGTQVDLGAFVTFKISNWASLDVRGNAARVPQVTGNKWQTSIQTLLTFSYAVVGDLDTAREDAQTLRNQDFEGASGNGLDAL